MIVHSRSKLSFATLQSTSSSRLGHVPDQDLMRSSLQSCLDCLDQLHERIDHVYKEMLEIHTRIEELLVTCQLEVTMGDEGALDSSICLQEIVDDEPQTIVPVTLDELNPISPPSTPLELSILAGPLSFQGQLSGLEYGHLDIASTLPEGVDRVRPDLLLNGTF